MGVAAGVMQIDLLPFRGMDLALDGGTVVVYPLAPEVFHMRITDALVAGEVGVGHVMGFDKYNNVATQDAVPGLFA